LLGYAEDVVAIVDYLDLPRCDHVGVYWGRPDKLRKKVRLAYGSIVLRPVRSTIHVRLTVTVVHYSRAILLVGDGEKSCSTVVRR
jgi:hypothetical protein